MHTSLKLLPYKAKRVVIINCGTKYFSTLALASVQRYSSTPVLMIDCESTDGSLDYFVALQRDRGKDFELISLPLRPHGITLDTVVKVIPSDTLILADSDIELRDANILSTMLERGQVPNCYGAGLLHKGNWMSLAEHAIAEGVSYYAERMWIPLTLLNMDIVRSAAVKGASFLAARECRATSRSELINRLMVKKFRIPFLRRFSGALSSNLWNLADPEIMEYDTGAKLHASLVSQGFHFEAIEDSYFGSVYHCHGATRAALLSQVSGIAAALGLLPGVQGDTDSSSPSYAMDRIRTRYPEYLL